MEELISIVVPVYNVENYIRKCIDSILKQTYKNFEIILVDDGSTDKSGEICDEYKRIDNRISVIHKKNSGLSDARNTGINHAKGKYITFVDSDDYLGREFVEKTYNAMINNNVDVVCCAHQVVYDTNKVINKNIDVEQAFDRTEALEEILYDRKIDLTACMKLYKKELFSDIRFPQGRFYEDAATTYKVIDKSSKIFSINYVGYFYTIRNNSITNRDFNLSKMDLITSTEEMCDYISNKYPNLSKACNRRLVYANLSTLSQIAMSKKRYKEQEEQIVSFIKNNGNVVLKDKKASTRDKFGVLCCKIGYPFYKASWNLYAKVSGRR